MLLSAGSRLGPYEILAPLGTGGMGEVWKARDTRLDRHVAIKILPDPLAHNPDRLARFEREAKTLAALNHPHIAAIYGLEETGSGRAIVMELVDGETLADRITRGPVPIEEALAIARQIGDALDAAHERDIVHRDLKPANIKLTADGAVKVLDFGLAKLVQQGSSFAGGGPEGPHFSNSPTVLSPAMTNVGVILGTAAYMAPEQARGKAVDKRADIWAFGVVFYELLTGRRLFEGETVSDTLAAVLTREPEWDRLPARARPLLRRCLEKDPKKRLRDIGDAWQLLGETPVASNEKRRWLWQAAAVVAAVFAAVALWAPWRSKPQVSDLVRRYQVPIDRVGAPFIEFAVSPDGQYLAYMTFDNRIKRLWIHALDARQAYEVPGAGGPSNGAPVFPFWSPDSRYVVFASGGKLRKVAVAGGPPQTICDVSMQSGTSGSWSRDGVILLGGTPSILRVSAAGGSTAVVAGTETTNGSFPTFLPDGRHFLYAGSGQEPGGIATFIGSLDGGPEEQKPLLTADSAVVFAPDGEPNVEAGYLLFRREGSLLAQRFDAARLQLVGEAMPVADRVGSFINFPFFSASSSGVLIHHPGVSDAKGQLTWLDRSGRPTGTVGDPSAYTSVSIAPDGKTVGLGVSDWSKPTRDLWVLSLDRGVATRLTFGPFVSSEAVWSPDSRQIIYSSRLTPSRHGIHRRSADGTGSEDTLLTGTSTEQPRPTSWSPDGRFVLYDVLAGSSGKRDIWVLPLDGRSKPFVYLNSPADESFGLFSPDGRFVAYSSDETGATEIYVRPFPDPNAGKWVISKGTAVGMLAWRQDGKALTYGGPSLSVRSVDISTTPTFQPGEPKELFKLAASSMGVAASRDGNRFLVAIPAAAGSSPYAPVPFTVVLNWQKALTH